MSCQNESCPCDPKVVLLIIFAAFYGVISLVAFGNGAMDSDYRNSDCKHAVKFNRPLDYLLPAYALGCWAATPFDRVEEEDL